MTSAPTEAHRRCDLSGLKAEAQRRQAAVVARYRAAHAGTTAGEKVVAALAWLEAEFGREPK